MLATRTETSVTGYGETGCVAVTSTRTRSGSHTRTSCPAPSGRSSVVVPPGTSTVVVSPAGRGTSSTTSCSRASSHET